MQCLESGKGCKVLEWKVEDGSFVNKDQIICKILEDGAESSRVLLAKHTGLIEVKAKTGTSADPRATLARFSPCTHNKMVVYGLCAICGQPAKNEKIVNTSGGVEISLSESSAKRFEGEVERRLQSEKKLAIAIDLDHTLINCEFVKGEATCLIDDLIQSGRVGPLPGVPDHYIALRPNVREFLVNLSNMYELYIYTHGRRHYAEAIRAMLDPKGTLFADRVISRSDVSEGDEIENRDSSRTKLFHKTFKRVLPCNDSMIVALDDKWDVWKYLPNVVRVRPYAFVSRVLNERAQKAKNTEQLIPASKPEFDLDEHLMKIVFHVLRDVHAEYFRLLSSGHSEPNVGSILCNIRKGILSGVVILFSGVFPRGETAPHRKDIWIMAESLGAQCRCGDLTDDITHVLGVKATLKMRQGFGKSGVFAVHLNWLVESAFRWKRQIESDFRIRNLTPAPLESKNGIGGVKRGHDNNSIETVDNIPTKRRRLSSNHVTLDSEGGDTTSSSSELDDDDIADIESGLS